jgi:hypothetical protein
MSPLKFAANGAPYMLEIETLKLREIVRNLMCVGRACCCRARTPEAMKISNGYMELELRVRSEGSELKQLESRAELKPFFVEIVNNKVRKKFERN